MTELNSSDVVLLLPLLFQFPGASQLYVAPVEPGGFGANDRSVHDIRSLCKGQ
jgi:hypothetical protein